MNKKTNSHGQSIQNNHFKWEEKEAVVKNVNVMRYDRSAKLTREQRLILNYGAVLYNLCS